MNASRALVSVCVIVVGLLEGTALAVNIATVSVGNPGNAADTRYATTGYGSVGYAYNIGKYEVTAGQYAEFLNAVAGVDAYGLYSTYMSRTDFGCGINRSGSGTIASPYAYSVLSEFVNRPANFVGYWDACRFANWLNNDQPTGPQSLSTTESGAYLLKGVTEAGSREITRTAGCTWALTNENEWYKAAYHKNNGATGDYWDYATSTNTIPGLDMADVSGNNANYHGEPFPIDSGKYTTIVGEFQNSASPYGTFDQGGNVWEWNESVITQSARGLRGGSYFDNDSYMSANYRGSFFMTTEYGRYGFRVVQLPEPCSALLLLAGCLIATKRRRGI